MTGTKTAWKRRALRAENELETLRKIRQFDHAHVMRIANINAARSVVLIEIQEILTSLRDEAGDDI